MNNTAIRVVGIGKRFRLGAPVRYRTLRETLKDNAATAFRFLGSGGRRKAPSEMFWALKDVSFEVGEGEVIGVIGGNGAGKSTLLKILSRITDPTEGEASIRGRVSSLLEVGTGFHPELTGRENVFLNGAILGMKKAEIRSKFDEIVAFSEIGQFIDTPVKHYSSGMHVRLAFAVAAHLEPEILIIDEVLAVGDVRFQKKCLGKMGEVSRAGRTILFVSHNMGAVQQLTTRCVLLDEGRVRFVGATQQAVREYLQMSGDSARAIYDVSGTRRPYPDLSRDVEFTHLWLPEETGGVFQSGDEIRFQARLRARNSVQYFRVSLTVYRSDGTPVGSGFSDCSHNITRGETQEMEIAIGEHQLAPGRYHLSAATGTGDYRSGYTDFDIVFDVCHFEVLPPEGDCGTVAFWAPGWGAVRFPTVKSYRMEALECNK